MKVVIIKYNAGNTFSVLQSLKRMGVDAVVSSDIDEIASADKIIFPGVGEAASSMRFIRLLGIDEVLETFQKPFLGICLGMQLMCSESEENSTSCLHIFSEKIQRFSHQNKKVPHIGWNNLHVSDSPLLKNISEKDYFYFVHSYFVPTSDSTTAYTEYGETFSSAIQKDNFFGVQFHPEKSGLSGEKLLKNFLKL